MSRGSTFTLYRKYNRTMSDGEYENIVKEYANHSMKHSYAKNKEEAMRNLPLVMSTNPFPSKKYTMDENGVCSSIHKTKTIKELRNYYCSFVCRDDKCFCDKLLSWDFGSMFDCLINEFCLDYYRYGNNEIEITIPMARELLTASNYLLNGKWSSDVERSMNNKFIKILADGNTSTSYWKYLNKNLCDSNNMMKFRENGYEITLKVPKLSETDESYTDCAEDNELMESYFSTLSNVLSTFLQSDNWERDYDDENEWFGYNKDYKLVLMYECWG